MYHFLLDKRIEGVLFPLGINIWIEKIKLRGEKDAIATVVTDGSSVFCVCPSLKWISNDPYFHFLRDTPPRLNIAFEAFYTPKTKYKRGINRGL